MRQNARAQLLVGDILRMLCRDDNGVHTKNFSVRIVFHCDLGFAIRPEEGKHSVLAYEREPLGQLVRERDGSRHQLRIFIHRIPKHHSLVAGAAGVYAHGDVARLLVDAGDDGASIAIKAVEGVVVSDRLDCAANDLLKIYVSLGGDFAGDDNEAGGGKSFASDAAGGIVCEASVEDCIGDLIGDFIGVTFSDGFRCEQITSLGWQVLSLLRARARGHAIFFASSASCEKTGTFELSGPWEIHAARARRPRDSRQDADASELSSPR